MQSFDYLAVVDFEATCCDGYPNFPQEIIEFPTVVLDAKTLGKVGEFHEYCTATDSILLVEECRRCLRTDAELVHNGRNSRMKFLKNFIPLGAKQIEPFQGGF